MPILTRVGAVLTALSMSLIVWGTPVCSAPAGPLIELSPAAQQAAQKGTFKSLDKIETILKGVSALRQLPIKRPVKLTVIDRKALQAELAVKIKEEIPPEKIAAEEAMYRQLDMLPRDFAYGQFILDLYTEQIGGFYDPKTRHLKLIEGMPLTGAEQEILIAHELTHALQDQHYELDKLMSAPERKANDDATLALMALVEGDATVTSMEYVQNNLSKNPVSGFFSVVGTLFNQARAMSSFKTFRSAPKFIQDSLVFPYQQGAEFVRYFRDDGFTWQDIGDLYDNLPRSTEHILHLRAYTEGNDPQPIALNPTLFEGHQTVTHSMWGELGYRQYLLAHLKWQEVKTASKGWAGDHYYVFEQNNHKTFAFVSRWDREQDAREFARAYEKTLKQRFKKKPVQIAENLQRWNDPEHGHVFLYEHKDRVLILENVTAEMARSEAFLAQITPDIFSEK